MTKLVTPTMKPVNNSLNLQWDIEFLTLRLVDWWKTQNQ
jgi:hypothetical protein